MTPIEHNRFVAELSAFVAGDGSDAQRIALADGLRERFTVCVAAEARHESWELRFVGHASHRFMLTRLARDTHHGGVPRWRVICMTCGDMLVHPGTSRTTPAVLFDMHVDDDNNPIPYPE